MAEVGVRPAQRHDVQAIADIHVRAWRQGYQEVLPKAALDEMTGPDARAVWTQRWTAAVTEPPSPRHRLLVAVSDGIVVGFAAQAPASDPDRDPSVDAELLTLLVDPLHTRAGHGSRLLAAAVDLMRDDGVMTAFSWVFETDNVLLGFLTPAGWAPDGARRTLDLGEPVHMIRLHTDLTPDVAP